VLALWEQLTNGGAMPGADEFKARLDMLMVEVGFGTLRGYVEVDQIYAHRQHEDVTLKHPRGGGPFYLTQPLLDHRDEYLQNIADHTLGEGGPQRGLEDSVEDLAFQVSIHAPVEFGFLRNSAHAYVTDDGIRVFDLPARAPRLTKEQIKALNRLRGRE
jgi:hypothetical protein